MGGCMGVPTFDISEWDMENLDESMMILKGEKVKHKKVMITNRNGLKEVPASFLCFQKQIEEISFDDSMASITHINKAFLMETKLKKVDLKGFKSVVSIDELFMSKAETVQSIDLAPLTGVESIGDSFLEFNKLSNIDLTPLASVKKIGEKFLATSMNLGSVDFSPLANVEEVGGLFVHFCQELGAADLSSMAKTMSVGKQFLASCDKLAAVNMSGMAALETIGPSAFWGCKTLATITMPTSCAVTSFPTGFGRNCGALSGTLDLSGLPLTAFEGKVAQDTGITAVKVANSVPVEARGKAGVDVVE